MIPIDGQPIVTTAQMRAIEQRAIDAGATVDTLMARAGEGVAHAAWRVSGGAEMLILCGPGNNGGDGYVAAATLRRLGHPVRVAATDDPRSAAAIRARALWDGPVEMLADAKPAPVLVDALFGTGLSRALDPVVDAALACLLPATGVAIAVDVPSGIDADTGAPLADYLRDGRRYAITLALGALKPAHVLHRACGAMRIVDLGLVDRTADTLVIAPPTLAPPAADAHKYSRGMVAVVAGAMEGAARLAGTAALRSGAGYAALYGGCGRGGPDALVHRAWSVEALRDPRIGAILIGPGLGRTDEARGRLAALIEDDTARLVIDGDALHLLDLASLAARKHPVVLTPHAGEFKALFGEVHGSPIEQARSAATRIHGHVLVAKGPTTIIADASRAIVLPFGDSWLSTAGTGDVLAGAIAAQVAGRVSGGGDLLEAASAGVWLHARAARIAGGSFIADDLANALTPARAGR